MDSNLFRSTRFAQEGVKIILISLNMEFSICGQMWSFLMGQKRTEMKKTFTLTLASCCCLLSKATLINVLEELEVMK